MSIEQTRQSNQAVVEKFFAKYTNERADLFTEDALLIYRSAPTPLKWPVFAAVTRSTKHSPMA